MRRLFLLPLLLFIFTPAQAQITNFADAFMGQMRGSSYKLINIAEAIPADNYADRITPESMSIEGVLTHIARYNFMYLAENMGIPAPEGVDYANMESVTGKDEVVAVLKASFEHLQASVKAMSEEDMAASTTLYGEKMPKWGVLFQLDSHLSEHQGQVIAYARAAGVTPPWSR